MRGDFILLSGLPNSSIHKIMEWLMMNDLLSFLEQHLFFTVLLAAINILPVILIVMRFNIFTGLYIMEAKGRRNENMSFYGKCMMYAAQYIKSYEKRKKNTDIYIKARMKMRKAGYTGEFAAAVYLFLKYILTALMFITGLLANYPDVIRPILLCAAFLVIIELVVAGARKKINLKFQKYIYKIYKYLHNQISSGVKVTDAIKTVYEVIDDKGLKNILIRLAARYELTLDIDVALEEFVSNFNVHEAETLCVALKQGIVTGDNQELLARQEEVMFKKYFNYIQAETDNCKTRSIIAAAMFTAIMVMMIVIPLLNDATNAVGNIFVG
jgi:Flp pilus assembly protein TadB